MTKTELATIYIHFLDGGAGEDCGRRGGRGGPD